MGMKIKKKDKNSNKEPPQKRVSLIKTFIVKQGCVLSKERELNAPYKAAEFIRKFYEGIDRECVFVCTFDVKCHPLSVELVSMGTVNQAIIAPREIFKSAILSCAASIMIFHNHLSGNPEPSNEDIRATKRLMESGDILGISLLDHIILGENGQYVSFRERNLFDSKEKNSYVTE